MAGACLLTRCLLETPLGRGHLILGRERHLDPLKPSHSPGTWRASCAPPYLRGARSGCQGGCGGRWGPWCRRSILSDFIERWTSCFGPLIFLSFLSSFPLCLFPSLGCVCLYVCMCTCVLLNFSGLPYLSLLALPFSFSFLLFCS